MKKFLKEYLSYIIIIIVVVLIRTFLVTPVRVNGSSMDNTLSDGEIMLLFKPVTIDREDIVVISKKVDGTTLIKRVIGMPGETIRCEDNRVYINDKLYEDKYANGITYDFDEVKLKDDEYFVLGDNRIVSADSRLFGAVKAKYIEGQTSFVLFPFKKFGKI